MHETKFAMRDKTWIHSGLTAISRTYTNVFTFRLIDSDGNATPLLLAGGVTNTALLVSNVVNAPAGSTLLTTNGVALRAASRLTPYSPHRVQLNVSGPFAPPGTTSNDVARLYRHFTNVQSSDAALNIISEASDLEWVRVTSVATDTKRNTFLARRRIHGNRHSSPFPSRVLQSRSALTVGPDDFLTARS